MRLVLAFLLLWSAVPAVAAEPAPSRTWKHLDATAAARRAGARDVLVKLLCDPRQLLTAYNELAAAHPRNDGEGLAAWSPDFLAGLTPAAPSAAPGPR
jgi:hypothetical protein